MNVLYRYFALELCAGTLKDWVLKKYEGPIPSENDCLFQMANGLAYIHSMKYAHRDISPDNVLIAIDGNRLLISDFGLCKQVTASGSYSISRNVGKETWQAPELIQPVDQVRGRNKSDTFALGCVFFHFLTKGLHPFEGKSKWEIQNSITKNMLTSK